MHSRSVDASALASCEAPHVLSEILPVQICGACCAGNDARHKGAATSVSARIFFMTSSPIDPVLTDYRRFRVLLRVPPGRAAGRQHESVVAFRRILKRPEIVHPR